MIPRSFVDRIAAFAEHTGHVGLKLGKGERLPVCDFFRRSGRVLVSCQKRDMGSDLREILTASDAGLSLDVVTACDERFSSFWSGRDSSGDRIVATLRSVESLRDESLIGNGLDPFVLQNLSTFMKKRGTRFIAALLDSADDDQVACAIVGPPSDIFFFGRRGQMKQLVAVLFERCQFSPQFETYTKGPFVPLETALRSLKKRSLESRADR